MLRFLSVFIVICFLSTGVCVSQELVSVDQAKAAVRLFEGNQSLEFGDVSLDYGYYDIPLADQNQDEKLDPETDEPIDENRYWKVDAETGVVEYMYDSSAEPDILSEEPFGPLTKDECHQIALNYARSKYADFVSILNSGDDGFWTNRTWKFGWGQVLPCGAETGCSVGVSVNPVTGSVCSYGSCRVAPFTVPDIVVTSEQALEIACNSTGITDITELDGPSLDADPGKLTWYMEIQGDDPEHNLVNVYMVSVDAVTGAVEKYAGDGDTDSGTPHHSKADKKNVKSRIWIRLLLDKIKGSRIAWLGKQGAVLTVGKDTYNFVPGKSVVKSTKGDIRLNAPLVTRHNRLLIPIGLINTLAPFNKH